jgi:hypothetical protein
MTAMLASPSAVAMAAIVSAADMTDPSLSPDRIGTGSYNKKKAMTAVRGQVIA